MYKLWYDLQNYYKILNKDLIDIYSYNQSSANSSKQIQVIIAILGDNGELKGRIIKLFKVFNTSFNTFNYWNFFNSRIVLLILYL